jgi:hypothetical protein
MKTQHSRFPPFYHHSLSITMLSPIRSTIRRWFAQWRQQGLAGKVMSGLLAWMVFRAVRRWMTYRHALVISVGKPQPDIHFDFFQNAQGLWIYHTAHRPPVYGAVEGCCVLCQQVLWIDCNVLLLLLLLLLLLVPSIPKAAFCSFMASRSILADMRMSLKPLSMLGMLFKAILSALIGGGLVGFDHRRGRYHVYALDHQGHGRSYGDRAHIEQFDDYVNDVMQYLQEVVEPDCRMRGLDTYPMFLLGHSMGGLIAVRTVWHVIDTTLNGTAHQSSLAAFTAWLHAFQRHNDVPTSGEEWCSVDRL